ncbi:hypothetical protein KY362_05330 [Candidatus Woesearchaeota archaeon]|nr:hypothetical protein [Candidatus Woesearchaeota archaeon]
MYESGSETHEFSCTLNGVGREFFLDSMRFRRCVDAAILSEGYGILDRVFTPFGGRVPAFMYYVPLKESHWISSTYAENDLAVRNNFETCRGRDAGWLVMESFIRQVMPEHVKLDTHVRRLFRDASDRVAETEFSGTPDEFLDFVRPYVRKCRQSGIYVVSLEGEVSLEQSSDQPASYSTSS